MKIPHSTTKILAGVTKCRYGYAPSSLKNSSSKPIVVKCKSCGITYVKLVRYVHQPHKCKVFKVVSGVEYKRCSKCNKYKPLTKFYKNKCLTAGIASCCSKCANKIVKKKKNTLEHWIMAIFRIKKSKCNKNNLDIDLTHDFLVDLWDEQDGKCYYTQIPMEFNKKTLKSASLDRVVPDKGYIQGNVVWATKGINHLKSNASVQEFADFLQELKPLTLPSLLGLRK